MWLAWATEVNAAILNLGTNNTIQLCWHSKPSTAWRTHNILLFNIYSSYHWEGWSHCRALLNSSRTSHILHEDSLGRRKSVIEEGLSWSSTGGGTQNIYAQSHSFVTKWAHRALLKKLQLLTVEAYHVRSFPPSPVPTLASCILDRALQVIEHHNLTLLGVWAAKTCT